MTRARVRADLAMRPGYHSPQVDVDVRLNTNESPLPPPAEFTEALVAEVAAIQWHRYPDRGASALRAAIADHHGVDASMVLAANGSNEVLQTVLLAYGGAGRAALTFEPTYAMHGQIARTTGTGVIEGDRRDDFGVDLDLLGRLVAEHQPAVVFLCSPNNPTGTVDPPETVLAALDAAHGHGGLVVVDEAYGQFAPRSAIELVHDDRSLVVTRTYSKTWAMAAARLGYLIGPSWLVSELEKVVLPYHLDTMSQAAGRVALRFEQAMQLRVAQLVEERGRLVAGLTQLELDVFPSDANFVLVRPRKLSGDQVWNALLDASVLVRNCSSWPRLENCLRITVGAPEENDRLLAALQEIL
jgi:histidinol-phosphate aminotransferase